MKAKRQVITDMLNIASSIMPHRLAFKDAKISVRLGLLVSFLAFLMMAGVALGWMVLNETEDELYDLFDSRLKPIQSISSIQVDTLKIRALLLRSIVEVNDSEDPGETIEEINTVVEGINDTWKTISIDETDDELNRLLENYKTTRFAYGTGTMFPIMEAVKNDDADEALMIQSVSEGAYENLEAAIAEIVDHQLTAASLDIADSINKKEFYKAVGIIGIAGGLVIAILISVFIIRGVVIPLSRAVKLANHVAEGNLTYDIRVDSEDEIGQLLQALQVMNNNLRGIVSDVHKEVEGINSNAIDVAESSERLADRINQESVTLDLTMSHMDHVVTTNQNAASSAEKAHTLAESARDEAISSSSIMQNAVAAMNTIDQSSEKISEITETIDSIAFQTNLLSLNAAVEAASAGEHGRGFAVVASEVRVLARKAAEASKDIKELINTSVAQIKTGKECVDQSGKALESIQGMILDVADIVKNIHVDSREQTEGIDIINSSIDELYEQSKSNSSSVVTTAEVSDEMKERVNALLALIGFFELKGEHLVGTRKDGLKGVDMDSSQAAFAIGSDGLLRLN